MVSRLRKYLTFSNVVSVAALFIVLGGSAYAALSKNSVGTKQLKKNAVTTAKIRNGAVTGAKIKASSLGTVPSATTAQNAANADRVGGQSATKVFKTLTTGQTDVVLATVSGFTIDASCSATVASVRVTAPPGAAVLQSQGFGYNGTVFTASLADSSSNASDAPARIPLNQTVSPPGTQLRYGSATFNGTTGAGTVVTGSLSFDTSAFNSTPPGTCVVYGHVLGG